MNNGNAHKNDVIDTRQIKRVQNWTSRIMDYGMHGILTSIFTDFIASKSSLFKCKGIIFGLGGIRQVFIWSGINKLNMQSEYRKIGSFNQHVLASHAHGYRLLGASRINMSSLTSLLAIFLCISRQ